MLAKIHNVVKTSHDRLLKVRSDNEAVRSRNVKMRADMAKMAADIKAIRSGNAKIRADMAQINLAQTATIATMTETSATIEEMNQRLEMYHVHRINHRKALVDHFKHVEEQLGASR